MRTSIDSQTQVIAAKQVLAGLVEPRDKKSVFAQLANITRLLEQELATIQPGAQEPVAEDGPSNTSFENSMANMVMALQMLQVKIASFSNKKASYDATISEDELQQTQDVLDKVKKQCQELMEKQQENSVASFWEKVAEGLVAAIMTILGVITAQPELLMVAALSIASASGLTSLATKGIGSLISDMLKACGVDPKKADEIGQILAAVLITAVVIAATACVAPNAAAEEIADTVEEVSSDVSDAAETLTTNVLEESEAGSNLASSALQLAKNGAGKLKSFFKFINVFNRLSIRTNMIIMNAIQTMSQTGLVTKIADAIVTDPKQKAQVEQDLAIMMAVLSIVSSVAGGTAIADMPQVQTLIKDPTKFEALVNRFRSIFQISQVMAVAEIARTLGFVGESVAGIYGGAVTLEQGNLEKSLGEQNAALALVQSAMGMNNVQITEDQRFQGSMLKGHDTSNRETIRLMAGEAAFATLFTTSSPV